MTTTIIGVSLENRVESSLEFQGILTDFGCHIRTRVGLHPAERDICLNRGIILLEVHGDGEELICALSRFWTVQTMTFE